MITTTREPPKIKSMKAENCGEGKIYTMGHWTMKEGSFEWVDGKCKRKKDGQNFIPAHWEKNQDDVWVLKQGRWEEIIPSEEK